MSGGRSPTLQRWKCLILSILCKSFTIAAANCPDDGNCKACQLTLSTNVSGIIDNTIRTTTGIEISFVVAFTNQSHNGFTFEINGEIKNPNFPCTKVRDTTDLTMTLKVYYYCTARVPGNYSIVSYVTFCNIDYYSQITYTVIAENAILVTSSTSDLSMSSTSNSVLWPQPTSSSVVLSSAIMLTAVLPTNTSVLPTKTADDGVIDPTKNQDEGIRSYNIDREVNECSYLRDIKIDNKSVYAPPSGSADLSEADINLPIRFHVFMEHGPQATALVTWIDQWITNQPIINQSLISSSIGVNVLEDIRFKLYFPTSFNSLTNRTNLYALYRNLDGITFLNQSEWKKLSDTYTIKADNYNKSINPASDPYAFCTGAAVEVLLNATEEIWDSKLYETSCPANFSQSCHDSYWEYLCIYKLRRTDIFKYQCDYGNITVKLFNQTGSKVFESTKCNNNFTLPDPGAYTVKIQTNNSARIRYNIISNCKDIRAYFDHLMKLDIDTTTVNVFLTGVRIKPYIYGRYEFITQSPISSGALMMIKWFDSIDSLDYFWRYLAEAFGADIQRENDSPSCKQLHTRLNNDTIIALHHPEKIRCNLYNSNDPFGKNFNRTKINITKADGKITTLYIPSSKISGSNHSLYCDKTKMCVWDITPNKTNHTKLVSAISVTATSMEQHCFGGNKWCERRSSPVLSTTKSITTSMQPIPNLISCLDTTNIVVSKSSTILRPTVTHCKDDNHNTKSFITEMKIIFGFFDDVSSLNYEDGWVWVWSKAQTSVTNSCIHKRTIKATIKINDINRLSRDLVLVQYQLRNGQLYLKDYQVCIMKIVSSYDCDEKVENMCHLQKFKLETWQVISFAFSSIVGIIDVVLAIWIWRCCH